MMPLSFLKGGDTCIVIKVNGTPEVRKHLEDLGFTEGVRVQVVSAPGKGNLIVSCRETRLAVTADMARRIMVNL